MPVPSYDQRMAGIDRAINAYRRATELRLSAAIPHMLADLYRWQVMYSGPVEAELFFARAVENLDTTAPTEADVVVMPAPEPEPVEAYDLRGYPDESVDGERTVFDMDVAAELQRQMNVMHSRHIRFEPPITQQPEAAESVPWGVHPPSNASNVFAGEDDIPMEGD